MLFGDIVAQVVNTFSSLSLAELDSFFNEVSTKLKNVFNIIKLIGQKKFKILNFTT